jgi:hypothetical protein
MFIVFRTAGSLLEGPSSRILPPPQSLIGTSPGHVKPQRFDDSRDSKNDSIFGARREMQRRFPPCTEPAWALQNSKATGQKCAKPWENQGFAARASEN